MAHNWEHNQGFEHKRGKQESPAAFEAFTAFLQLGNKRNQQTVCEITGQSRNMVRIWSKEYAWKDRAAAYDGYMMAQRFNEVRADSEAKHKQAIIRFRDDQARRARAMGNLAELLLDLTREKVEAMRAAGELPSEQQLSNLAKTVATLGETSMNLEAAALGVEELLDAELGQ